MLLVLEDGSPGEIRTPVDGFLRVGSKARHSRDVFLACPLHSAEFLLYRARATPGLLSKSTIASSQIITFLELGERGKFR